MDIRPLEISNKDPLEIRLVADTVGQKEFEPCSNMLPYADGEIQDDDVHRVVARAGGMGLSLTTLDMVTDQMAGAAAWTARGHGPLVVASRKRCSHNTFDHPPTSPDTPRR